LVKSRNFEEIGSPVISDGEQTKSSFVTYPLEGLPGLVPDGVVIPFADGHTRQLPRLTARPFRYARHASAYTDQALRHATRPVKQAVIATSAISLLYPPTGSRAIHGSGSSRSWSTRRKPTSAGPSMRGRTASRSISPKDASR
jgi:hypothetical protein